MFLHPTLWKKQKLFLNNNTTQHNNFTVSDLIYPRSWVIFKTISKYLKSSPLKLFSHHNKTWGLKSIIITISTKYSAFSLSYCFFTNRFRIVQKMKRRHFDELVVDSQVKNEHVGTNFFEVLKNKIYFIDFKNESLLIFLQSCLRD